MFLFESETVYLIFPTALSGAETLMTVSSESATLLETLNMNNARFLLTFKMASVKFDM